MGYLKVGEVMLLSAKRSRSADLAISIISADNIDLLVPCLQSVFDNTRDVTLEVYVVDNVSGDDTAEVVGQKFPQVTVIRNDTRQGFSTNNNKVLKRASGRYLMLLNDDTLIQDEALDRMVAFMEANPGAGAVGGYLLNPDGSFQPCFASFPNPLVEGVVPAGFWYHRLVLDTDSPFEVDSVCGAAMMVRRETMEQVGVLDTDFDPIYSEEVDWCYRIKDAGWTIYTLPQARLIHYGGSTMNKVVPRKYELLLSHRAGFFRKHNGEAAVIVYKAALEMTTLVKFFWWLLVGVVRPSDPAPVEKRRLHSYLLRRIPSF
jgi:GT2 family glycosyltransferase